jgi:tetratricopeptide (TPR) repeat protein
MIRLVRVSLAFLPLLFISGCAFIHSFDSDLDKQVDAWMAQHEYSKVLDTLQYIRPSNPKYQTLLKKRQQAIAEARRYEQEQISKTLTLIEKGQWHEAELTLNDAIEKLPTSQPLQKTHQELIRQRTQYLNDLYCQMDINRAEWLVKDKPLQQQLVHAIPDDKKNLQAMEDYRKDTQRVYQHLLVCANAASNINDLELADRCYQLANKIQPSASVKSAIADIQEKLSREQKPIQEQKQKTPPVSQLGRNLLDKSKKALQAGNLKLALSYYDKIPGSDKNQATVKAYMEEMNHRIRDNVNQGIELGRKLYSQGQVEQALAVWNKLRELDPDNENLLSHIDRAERVLEKIKQLRKEQHPETPVVKPDSNK